MDLIKYCIVAAATTVASAIVSFIVAEEICSMRRKEIEELSDNIIDAVENIVFDAVYDGEE